MTFIYELDPYCLEIYWIGKYELPAFESYHQTNRQTESTDIIDHATSRVVKKQTS